jgi:hypothetical protein
MDKTDAPQEGIHAQETDMTPQPFSTPQPQRYELRFASLHQEGRALVFPCDRSGHVDFDGLNEKARNNYFYARSTIGRDFALPRIDPVQVTH